MNLHYYFINAPHPDLWLLYTMTALLSIFLLIAIAKKIRSLIDQSKPLELSSTPVDNVYTLDFGIACQIRRCKTPEDFHKAVAAIGRYESEFAENDNAAREANILKEILDVKTAEVYGVETIFS